MTAVQQGTGFTKPLALAEPCPLGPSRGIHRLRQSPPRASHVSHLGKWLNYLSRLFPYRAHRASPLRAAGKGIYEGGGSKRLGTTTEPGFTGTRFPWLPWRLEGEPPPPLPRAPLRPGRPHREQPVGRGTRCWWSPAVASGPACKVFAGPGQPVGWQEDYGQVEKGKESWALSSPPVPVTVLPRWLTRRLNA